MITEAQKKDILQEARQPGFSPIRAAKKLGLDVLDVWRVTQENPVEITTEHWGGEGRPDLRRYIVAKASRCQQWNNTDPAIHEARQAHERGTHDLCHHYDGQFKFLVLIPRKYRDRTRLGCWELDQWPK